MITSNIALCRTEKTLASTVTALLSSPNESKLSPSQLTECLSSIFPLVVKANSTHAKDVHVTTFSSLHTLFEHMPSNLTLNEDAKVALDKLLFNAGFEGLPEAMRMKRAEAIVVICRATSCMWIVEKVRPEVEGAERAALVRAVLAKAGKE